MASHSPQRTRRQPQAHPMNQGMTANVQLRESSQSPPPLRERPRASKAQSMPLVPQTAQMYSQGGAVQQISQPPLQASPTGSGSSRRSPPPAPPPPAAAASQRLHATPPLTTLQGEPRISPPLSQISQNQNPHYAHPANRLPPAPPLAQYQHSDSSYGITPELLADIDLADFHQSQTQTQTQNVAPVYASYAREDSATPPKDLNVSRVRTAERASPREFDNAHQHRQRESTARESPKVRQSNSPTHAAFVQVKSNTPERRESPARSSPMASSTETYVGYSTRESPPIHKRSLNVANMDSSRSQYSLATSTPPLQAIPMRSSDRSLPVQEEPEDDPRMALKHDLDLQEGWSNISHIEQHHRQFSPAPSSDLHPEGNAQRFEHPAHHPIAEATSGNRRTGNYDAHYKQDEEDDGSDEAHTPRSPSVGLPDNYSANSMQPSAISSRVPPRVVARNASMDQYGLRSIDQTMYQPILQPIPSSSAHPAGPTEHPQQYQDPRKLNINPHVQPQNHGYPSPASQNGYYHPEDYHLYGAYTPYHDDYAERIRPDAPIPPTPHSQTAAPSPSPLISATSSRNGKNYATPSPIVPVGSPYPFPYNHMRRRYVAPDPKRPPLLDHHDPELIREQMARQWQIYAQNGNVGELSDSTFSPSTTPFQGAFNHWANFYVQRTLGRTLDPHGRSRQSSPSHDSMRFSPAPMLYKKKRQASKLSSEISSHKPQPPPRVESTQPRETSPEPSSSGEETAGEGRFPTTPRNSWNNGVVPEHVEEDDGDGDWVDEDEEPDEDDMLELEYHPSFINTISKRRRRWEIGWETLVENFQALDRQTDATMVLLAAPSHSTKLYSLRSRSVRRQAMQTNAPDLTPLRVGFRRIAAHRRNSRSLPKSSLVDRFLVPSSSSGEGSDGSEVREGELKRALETAVTSLGAFRHIFEEREVRWMEEMRKISEERERIANVLAQVLGEQHSSVFSGTPL